MDEKIKIYITKETYRTLLNDMNQFRFTKNNQKFNKNDFINTLIMNYFDFFQDYTAQIYKEVNNILINHSLSIEMDNAQTVFKIVHMITEKELNLNNAKFDTVLSFRPSKKSKKITEYIQQQLLYQSTISSYFRTLITSYTQLPQFKRERIIFRQQFETICSAIDKKQKIFLSIKHKDEGCIVSPYAVVNSNSERSNFLISQIDNTPNSIGLRDIEKVIILNESYSFNHEMIFLFDKMIEHAPEMPIYTKEIICIQLSNIGKEVFERTTFLRPTPIKIEGDHYFFDCSRAQIIAHFTKYGKHAKVLSPSDLRDSFIDFYQTALEQYGHDSHNKLSDANNSPSKTKADVSEILFYSNSIFNSTK